MYNSEGPREWLLDPGTACPSPGSRDLLSRAHLKFSLTENPHLSQNSESAKNPLLPHLKKKKKAELASPSFGLFSTEGGSENQQLQEEFANAPSLRESRHRLPFGKVVKTPPWPVESGLCNLDGEPPAGRSYQRTFIVP